MDANELAKLGVKGPHFKAVLNRVNGLISDGFLIEDAVSQARKELEPTVYTDRETPLPYSMNIDAENISDLEFSNVSAVKNTMDELMRHPMVESGTVMPDACPAGPLGTIPVGGVVASKHLHPGMHSADICCSLMLSDFGDAAPAQVLDDVFNGTHFGPGGRKDEKPMTVELAKRIEANPLTRDLIGIAGHHMGTQGDGNHFAYVGTLSSTGNTVLVTHHGSRGFGAKLYKKGMRIAENYRKKLAPSTRKQNAWIPNDAKEFDDYWDALQIIRMWTKENHLAIHRCAGESDHMFWNEHNFVFKRAGLYYHAKGATPAFDGWAHDATELTIIPLNMAEPILIVKGKDNPNGLGFSPHGAGRNYSRTAHKKTLIDSDADVFERETSGIDARFYSGIIDTSELPSAYKNADQIKSQVMDYGLAEVVDEVVPYGCIMAGDWEASAPWRNKGK